MNLYKSFSIYIINNLLNAIIPFLLLPVLTSYLSREEYGILANLQVFITFSLPFVMLGIHGAINTAYFRTEREQFPSYVSSAFLISFVCTFIVLAMLLLFSPLIRNFLEVPLEWLLIIPLISLFQTVCTVTLVIFQARKEPVRFGAFQIGMTLTNFSLSMLFVAVFSMSWAGRLLGIMLSFFIFLIVGLALLWKMGYLTRSFSKIHIRDALKFGIPLIPHAIAAPVIQMLDRPLISEFVSIEWAGVYAVAFQLGVSVNLAAEAFNKAWSPYLFGQLGDLTLNKKKKLVKQSYLFMLLFITLPFLLYLVLPLIFKWFIGPSFQWAQEFVFPIALGAGFGAMYYTVSNYIFYEKKTWMLAIVTLSCAGVSVGLNFVLIPYFGTIGAAYTFLTTNIIMFIAVWILSNRVFPMPWFTFLRRKNES